MFPLNFIIMLKIKMKIFSIILISVKHLDILNLFLILILSVKI